MNVFVSANADENPNELVNEISFSYSPYHGNFNNITGPHPTQEDIKKDIEFLSTITRTLLIYDLTPEQLEFTAKVMEKYDMALYASINIDELRPYEELDKFISIANHHKSTIKAIIIGNDFLFIEPLKEDLFLEYIKYLKENNLDPQIKIASSNPAESWYGHEAFFDELDLVLVHIHPYWETIKVNDAPNYVFAEFEKIKNFINERSPSTKVILGEIGWPSNGKTICNAVPSENNQYLFFKNFLDRIKQEDNLEFFIFEAFDENTKTDKDVSHLNAIIERCTPNVSNLNRHTEAHWGFFDKNEKIKPQLQSFVYSLTDSSKFSTIITDEKISINFDCNPLELDNDLNALILDIEPKEFPQEVIIKKNGEIIEKFNIFKKTTLIIKPDKKCDNYTIETPSKSTTIANERFMPPGYVDCATLNCEIKEFDVVDVWDIVKISIVVAIVIIIVMFIINRYQKTKQPIMRIRDHDGSD